MAVLYRHKKVNFFIIIFSITLFFAGFTLARAEEGSLVSLKIAFIAYENPEQLIEDVRPVVDYLEKNLGRKIKYFVATDYASVVEALRNETADVGFMGSLQYVMAHVQTGAYPILGEIYNGKSSYVSRIFVRKDRGIKKLADLKGKTIAFVDPFSSSGYMYPLDLFKQEGLIKDKDEADKFFKKIYFAGGDEQVIRAVLNKFVDAAGIGQYAYSLLPPEERDEVMDIAETKSIPSHCIVVRKDLDTQLVEKLTETFLALNEGPNHKLLKSLYGVDGYIQVTHQDYAEVEAMARDFDFIKKREQ